MGRVLAAGEVIALSAIEDDATLHQRVTAMPLGASIELDAGGFVGRWERIADGIRPVGAVVECWSSLRGRTVDLNPVGPNETRLATFEERLYRWDIPESRIYSR